MIRSLTLLLLFCTTIGYAQAENNQLDSATNAQIQADLQSEPKSNYTPPTSTDDDNSNTTVWDDWFMPGFGAKLYIPKNVDSLGTYTGIMTEFIIYAYSRNSKTRRKYGIAPSRAKTYGNLSIMKSNKGENHEIFFANFGLNLSFESKANRNFFIPYFGIETGGMFQRTFSSYHFTPLAGIQIISSKRAVLSIEGGYQYTTKRFDEFSGILVSTSLNFLLWN